MASYTQRLVTAATTNLTLLDLAPTSDLHGWVLNNTAAYSIFVKFYWFTQNGTNLAPTVGTTLPALTVTVPTLASKEANYENGLTGQGDLYVAVTKAAADTDTTAVAAGDGILTFILGG